ncbi:substrate-binding periplasmic protein [Alteromonas flava]|uniref:substrate-binding periplasmic protein n=1 Tax=Alteromonas flava TaxID=2048003 RepID=UPI000C286C6E|nr:transporter substrate-binding domain-containing protein [Alteromonas flava]
MTRHVWLLLVGLVILPTSFLATQVSAKEVTVAIGWNKPPYVVHDTDSGFELELTRYILSQLNHKMTVIYIPFGRTPSLLKNGQVDIGLTMNTHHDINPDWLSKPYVAYQNVAISLVSNDIVLTTVDALRYHSVVAFQTAKTVLGERYANAVSNRPDYLELPDQQNQVSLLLRGSVDVAIMDENIFRHFRQTVTPDLREKAVRIHRLFPKSLYAAGIVDDDLRFAFNRELALALADGTYSQLLQQFNLIDLLNRPD